MNIWIERCYPFIIAIVISGIYLCFFRDHPFPETMKSLFSSVISISAISIGFLATSKSILFAIHDRKTIHWIKSAGVYTTLVDYMMVAIHLCFILATISAIGLLINPSHLKTWYPWAFGFWLFIGTAAAFSCYRVIRIFAKILRAET